MVHWSMAFLDTFPHSSGTIAHTKEKGWSTALVTSWCMEGTGGVDEKNPLNPRTPSPELKLQNPPRSTHSLTPMQAPNRPDFRFMAPVARLWREERKREGKGLGLIRPEKGPRPDGVRFG